MSEVGTDMVAVAERYGFSFSRTGCACNGSPKIYVRCGGYELWLFVRRGMWRLLHNRYIIGRGTGSTLEEELRLRIKD